MEQATLLCPKEVAGLLGVGERTAGRLMAMGEIQSMRAGQKLWRTTRAHVAAYQRRQFELAQQGPGQRKKMQTVACLRELERLGLITPEQQATLDELESELVEEGTARRPVAA